MGSHTMEAATLAAVVLEAHTEVRTVLVIAIMIVTETGKVIAEEETKEIGGIEQQTKFLPGLVMRKQKEDADKTRCTAAKDQEIISVLMTGSKMISMTA